MHRLLNNHINRLLAKEEMALPYLASSLIPSMPSLMPIAPQYSIPHTKSPLHALKKYFGYDSFHPTQEKAIKSVLAGKDTFVLMPTGGGKSMCFQIPALIQDGTTIVVSPLIALMKDQVDGLKVNGIAAEFLNSSLTPVEQSEITEKLLAGEIDLLYVSAERLVSPDFMMILQKIKINLFAIDEAHCISAWGHDFRPQYTQLAQLKTNFPKIPIIGLTATADASTRADILKQLELNKPKILIDSFDRPNISLTVLPGKKRLEKIRHFLSDKENQSGIIYCLSRKQTESMAEKLQQSGLRAASYHAGLNKAERSRVQQSFVRDRTQIICATIAFGMGIDKSNVRWVIHYNLPKNIEGYYQEIGRAGRDSAPAQALLFYTYSDVEMIKRFFLDSKQSELQTIKLDRIKEYAEGVICRRQVLLSYFDENYKKKCGNCDICANPYISRDGTKIARKILSEINISPNIVTKELINILTRASNKVSFASWHFYLAQLKNQSFISVNFNKNGSLTLTKKGKEILSSQKKVRLVTLETFMKRQEELDKKTKKTERGKSKKVKKSTKKDSLLDSQLSSLLNSPLFEKLRQKRSEIAKENNVPAYVVFSDKTLLEMVHKKPQNKEEMLEISGVGEVKWERYGEEFIRILLAK